MCINADTKIELPQQLKACFSSSTAQKLVRRRKVRELGTACVALHARPPLRQSWLGLALTSGLLHHSHRHTAPAWDVGIQGHHPQETRQKPSPTPLLTEGMLSTESTSYPGCFQFVRLGFAHKTAALEKSLLEKLDRLRNTTAIRLTKCLVQEEKK